ncbi:hypothetical protein [Qipengyuania atrilutea]|uniref:Uncharacterized protein n=1 Tax=Qipengyuania atrilutea TaxID=2744473 RepID=A0A850GYD1_9SPHN|nr:hypothetical protein [Actirhodobacter atriluteus]NVD44634.1 hypothetical protein [Actirhodobacter atriluteus]
MSSSAATRIRLLPAMALTVFASAPLGAQETPPPAANTAEQAIDEARDAYGPPPPNEECRVEQDAATITGEIIVCRRLGDQSEYRLVTPSEATKRYAEETMNEGNPKTPDFISDCHDQGWPAGCVRVGSVPPPAYIIDFDTLPDAPPGSDADRIARGLPPLGRDVAPVRPENSAATPEGSASPEAEQ